MVTLPISFFVNAGWMRDGQLLEKQSIDKIRHIPTVRLLVSLLLVLRRRQPLADCIYSSPILTGHRSRSIRCTFHSHSPLQPSPRLDVADSLSSGPLRSCAQPRPRGSSRRPSPRCFPILFPSLSLRTGLTSSLTVHLVAGRAYYRPRRRTLSEGEAHDADPR